MITWKHKGYQGILSLALGSCLSLAGCATVFRGTNQKVPIFTDPPGATATVGDQQVTTPGELRLPRKAKSTEVRIEKPGFETRTVILERRADGLVWLNVLALPIGVTAGAMIGSNVDDDDDAWFDFGKAEEGAGAGAILLPAVAFATDYRTGAAYRLVPPKVVVKLVPSPGKSAEQLPRDTLR